ncbi:hypothetical protein [Mesorhizobium sp.]|uniref:hypothetical protein n=1 Tax=Mesorhizobium sp. TaxID=1871066 RepID=UPI0025BCFE00|nr:hypothetical protein [Mesorhizobium sp.]
MLPTLLSALRLPSISRYWKHLADTADRDGWPAANLLACLLEIEMAERAPLDTSSAIANSPACRPAEPSPLSISTSLPESESPVISLATGEGWI